MGKILVVDDQVGVRHLLCETFREDHEIETAANSRYSLKNRETPIGPPIWVSPNLSAQSCSN